MTRDGVLYDDVPTCVWMWPLLSGVFWAWSLLGWSAQWADGFLTLARLPAASG